MDGPTPKPVLFQRPANWHSMSPAEREQYVDHLLDLMGWREEGPK